MKDSYSIDQMLLNTHICDEEYFHENIASGLLNDVYKITCGKKEKYILRIRKFYNPHYGQEFCAERFAYDLISNVNYPKLHYLSLRENERGFSYAIFEFIEGVTLAEKISTLSDVENIKIFDNIAWQLSNIHKVKPYGFGTHTIFTHKSVEGQEFLFDLFLREEIPLQKINPNLAFLFKAKKQKLLDFIKSIPFNLIQPTLIHGDIHGKNIIINNDDDIYLIDWEASRYRVLFFDFCQIRQLNLVTNTIVWKEFLRSYLKYSNINLSLEDFEIIINFFEAFSKCRMAIFQHKFPYSESDYFGTSETNFSDFEEFIKKI